MPVTAPRTQDFGDLDTNLLPWDHPLILQYGNYQPGGHKGIDFGCPIGTPVYAIGDAIVDHADWGENAPGDICSKWALVPGSPDSGILVLLDHSVWYQARGSMYAHLDSTHLNRGDKVKAGQLIGHTGNTGRSGGPHLHFELTILPAPWVYPFYGRMDPLPHIGQVTLASTTPKGTLSVSDIKAIMARLDKIEQGQRNTDAILVKGYRIAGKSYPSIAAVGIETQKRVDATPAKTAKHVWQETKVKRDGKLVSALQDMADGTTLAAQAKKMLTVLSVRLTHKDAETGTATTV